MATLEELRATGRIETGAILTHITADKIVGPQQLQRTSLADPERIIEAQLVKVEEFYPEFVKGQVLATIGHGLGVRGSRILLNNELPDFVGEGRDETHVAMVEAGLIIERGWENRSVAVFDVKNLAAPVVASEGFLMLPQSAQATLDIRAAGFGFSGGFMRAPQFHRRDLVSF